MHVNPYNAPASGPQFSPGASPYPMGFVPPLASVGARFFARLIDGLLPSAAFFFYFFASITSILGTAQEGELDPEEDVVIEGLDDFGEEAFEDEYDEEAFEAEFDEELEAEFDEELEAERRAARKRLLLLLIAFGAFQCLQYYLISTSGQSIGKKLLGIRIVTEEGRPVRFWDGVFKRELIMGALTSIPLVGGFIGLYDTLSIFSADRRMLHDRIAGTIVVRADAVGPEGVQPNLGEAPSYASTHGHGQPGAATIRNRPPVAPIPLPTHGPPRSGARPDAIPLPGGPTRPRLAGGDALSDAISTAPITPELARRVDARLAELARHNQAEHAVELYRIAAARPDLTLSDRSILIVEQAANEIGESELAVSLVRTLMSTHPGSELIPRAMWDVAQIQQRAGREDLARATLEGIIDRFPGDPFAIQARARLGK